MRVLMLGRYGLLKAAGGDRVQIENTAMELRKLGVKVDIKTDLNFDPKLYDLVHVFQLDWIPEMYFFMRKALKAKKPVVLSPIHHSVAEVKKFDDTYVFDFRRISRFFFNDQFKRDTFKNLYRSLFNLDRLFPTLYSVFFGFKNMQTSMMKNAKMVLVQTELEARDLKDTYGVSFSWEKVPNGVGSHFINQQNYQNKLGFEDYIISVGRIEPRKNQLHIIEAVKQLRDELNKDIRLVLIGRTNKLKHFEYMFHFNRAKKKYPWIIHLEKVDYMDIPSYYHFAKVGVSASWFETTGLTSLEALFCGTNAVASGARAQEYLQDFASYCDPCDTTSIKEAIRCQYIASRPQLSDDLLQNYTWENAAKKTLEVYNKVLGIL